MCTLLSPNYPPMMNQKALILELFSVERHIFGLSVFFIETDAPYPLFLYQIQDEERDTEVPLASMSGVG